MLLETQRTCELVSGTCIALHDPSRPKCTPENCIMTRFFARSRAHGFNEALRIVAKTARECGDVAGFESGGGTATRIEEACRSLLKPEGVYGLSADFVIVDDPYAR